MEGKSWWTSAMSGGIVRWRILARLRPTACWRQSIIVYDDELPNSPPSRGLAPSLWGDMAGNVCLCPHRTCSLCPHRTCTSPSRGFAPSLRGEMAGNTASVLTGHVASVRAGHAHLPLGDLYHPFGETWPRTPPLSAQDMRKPSVHRGRHPPGHGNRFRSLPPGDG